MFKNAFVTKKGQGMVGLLYFIYVARLMALLFFAIECNSLMSCPRWQLVTSSVKHAIQTNPGV